jgi:nucleobase:cation symporter-1, NCS1 family
MVAIVLNGVTGARLHIPFPVLNRSSMGFCLSCQYYGFVIDVALIMLPFRRLEHL